MRNSPLLLVVGLVVLFAAGCTGPDPETLQACDAKGACPSGFSCNVDDNKCYDDSLGPNTMLLNHPDAVTNQTTAVFEFASPETLDATFECKLDDKAYAPCQSAFHAVVAEGTHKFRVRAVLGGTADPSPASYTWTVDSSTPDTMITGGPSGTVSMSEASFTFSSNEAQATFTCQLDDKPAERCTSGKSYALQDGAHVFRVYATDPAGNVDPTPAEAHFTVDTMGPVVTIDSGPQGGATVGPAVRFTFTVDASGPEVATIACSIDGAALPCAGGSVDAVLKSGVHTFVVVATDPIGNQGEAMRAFTVDATGPVVTITSPASGETTGQFGKIRFDADDNDVISNFRCTLDGKQTSCDASAGLDFGNLADGPHTVVVYATDEFGNVSAPATVTWTVDATPPTVTIISPTSGSTTSSSVNATFEPAKVEDGLTYRCSIDGAVIDLCASPTKLSLSPGPHTFSVSATDRFGNVGQSAQVSFNSK